MKIIRAVLRTWPPVLLALALLTIWQLYVQLAAVNPLILPAPLRILSATLSHSAVLQAHLGTTLNETLIGLLAALAAGVLTAALIDLSPLLRRALYPLLVASQAIPIIAIAPLMIFWFGYGLLPKVLVVLLVCFFPITVALADGLRSTDPELIKLYRTFGAGELTIFWRVRLPHALPSFFSGLKIATTYSVIGAIFGEYVGAIYGLGVLLQTEQRSFRTDLLFGVVFITVLLSVALFLLVSLIERVALPWYFAGGRERDWREAGRRPKTPHHPWRLKSRLGAAPPNLPAQLPHLPDQAKRRTKWGGKSAQADLVASADALSRDFNRQGAGLGVLEPSESVPPALSVEVHEEVRP